MPLDPKHLLLAAPGAGAQGQPAAGARSEATWPVARAPQSRGAAAAPGRDAGSAAETILLVDDDDQVRRLLERVLRGRGYAVLRARGGEEALRTVRDEAGRIDLLVTDVLMRPMGGFELAQRVCALRPGIRVLYISGQLDRAALRFREVPPGAMLLPKPFRPADLADSVRQLLDGPPGGDAL